MSLRVYGLTGGIATGKSTVASMFAKLGAQVLDADVLARVVVEPGTPASIDIAARFPEVIEQGVINRAALGARIFSNLEERLALNAIVHPRVRDEFERQLQLLEAGGVTHVIYDVPLLIENNLHKNMWGVILVTAPPPVQLSRLIARSGLSAEQAALRIASQMPLDEKRRYATWVIENGGTLPETSKQVEEVWRAIITRG